MKALVRSKLPPAQRQAMPTFSSRQSQLQTDRMAKMAEEQRKLKAAQVGADPDLHYTLHQRSELLGRRMDRLAGRAEKLQQRNDA